MAISVKLGERKVWKVNVGVASTGTKDHNKLENRDAKDQHPMSSISGLDKALEQKAPSSHQHKKEDITDFPKSLPASDVYDWAKQPQKPSYTASEVKARPDNWTPSATDVGAHPNTWLPTPEQIGAAPALDWSKLKWYVMGDSLTAQDNAFTDKRYYDFVQEKTGIQVIVDGIGGTGYGAGASNGESYYDRVQNIPDDVDIVTIFGSGNDIRFAESANMEIYNTLSWMALNKPGLRVIVVPPAPWLGYNKREDPWKAYCDRLQACALTCNFRYVSDMYDCPPFNPNFPGHMEVFFTTDPEGIHPDENGHKALAPYFYNALLEELALDKGVVVSPGGSGGSGGSGGAVNIPDTLPNPHKLTFTGAVTAEYDGSKEVTVKIPEGGSGGGIEVTGASVGQTIVVKAVDDNGKPTEWETADLPQGGGEAEWTKRTITLEEAVSQISFELPSAKKMFVVLYLHVNDKDNSLNTGNDICMMRVNDSLACRFDCYTRQSVKFVNVIDFEKVGSHKKLIRTNQYQNGAVWNGQETMYMSGWQHAVEDKTETINTVKFVLNGANLLFQNDSYLEVYYQ